MSNRGKTRKPKGTSAPQLFHKFCVVAAALEVHETSQADVVTRNMRMSYFYYSNCVKFINELLALDLNLTAVSII
jgi:hypothetical protein